MDNLWIVSMDYGSVTTHIMEFGKPVLWICNFFSKKRGNKLQNLLLDH